MKVLAKAALAGAALTLATTVAGAQATASSCAVDLQKGDLAKANKSITVAQIANKPEDKQKNLAEAVRTLSRMKERDRNTPGYDFLLGQALAFQAALPTVGETAKRSALGFQDNPDATVDVLVAADSAFDRFEAAMPQCAGEVVGYRQQPWVPLVNGAIQAVQAEKYDSAAHLAQRSLLIYGGAPHAHHVLAAVAQQRGDNAGVLAHMRHVYETAANDTSYAEFRKMAREAIPSVTRDYARTMLEKGDSARYDSVLVAASKDTVFITQDWQFQLCVDAARSNRFDAAAATCEAGLAVNPFYRDGLYLAALTYYNANQPDKMLPYAKRLVEVDPSNPESWELLAGVYQLRSKDLKDAKAKKVLTDSTVALMEKAQALPAKVTFQKFTTDGSTRTLVGSVENLGKAAKNFTVKVEFLDRTGAVVSTQEATVSQVAPKKAAEFTVTAQGDSIVAYRYAPLM